MRKKSCVPNECRATQRGDVRLHRKGMRLVPARNERSGALVARLEGVREASHLIMRELATSQAPDPARDEKWFARRMAVPTAKAFVQG